MSNLSYTALALLLGGLFSAALGLLIPPKTPKRLLVVIAVLSLCGAAAVEVAAERANRASTASGSAHCPAGTTDRAASTSPIADVQVTSINSVEVCVTWANPDDPTVAGFIITQYPQGSTADQTPSGAPYPNPRLSSQLVNVEQFVASTRPEPGQQWKICVTPFAQGLDSNGDYPMLNSRQGCSATFTWP